MDIKEEKSELSETIKLVEAVLERLTFHAFEDVLIWSNEHASRALTLCLKKTLKEFENRELILTSSYPKLKHFSVDNVVRGLSTTLDQAQERQDNLNKEIDELSDQLAKAQAVPEGFVLVNKKDLARVLICVTDDWLVDTDSFEEFKKIESLVQDEVNAMFEAQEPDND